MMEISREAVLARIIEVEETEIKEALVQKENYREVKIPKREGGYRTIYVSPVVLKKVQRKILRNLLKKLWGQYFVLSCPYGIYGKTSSMTHIHRHIDSRYFFQFDLKDAFPSVDIQTLREMILETLLQEVESYLKYFEKYINARKEGSDFWEEIYEEKIVSSLFHPVRIKEVERLREEKDEWVINLTELIMELTTHKQILPQGTPTAPFLFYLAVKKLVNRLNLKFESVEPSILITVYIDNFVVSSQQPIPFQHQQEILKIIEEQGFQINPKKVRHQDIRHGAPLITGLRITEKDGRRKIVLSKKQVRRLRGLIFRAIYEPQLRPKMKGIINSLKPIYGKSILNDFPSQIMKPYVRFWGRVRVEKIKSSTTLF